MKAIRILIVTFAVLVATSSVAWADIILVSPTNTPVATVAASFTDLGGNGFGNAPRLLTLQTNGIEIGSVIPVNQPQGDAVPNSGGNKSNTPTLAALQWDSGNRVGIGFNSGQTGNTGITLNSLTLTIYNGAAVVGTFNLAASLTPLQFSAADLALQQGNGNAVFNFGLSATQQAQFNAILAANGGVNNPNLRAGLAASLGCATTPSATCQPSNDGPDSFLGFRQNIPDSASVVSLGLALLGLGYFRKRMVRA